MPIKMLLAVLVMLTSSTIAAAEMYRWVESNGVVTFKDTPPPPAKKLKKVKVYSDGDFAPAPEETYVPSKRTAARSAVKGSQPQPAKPTSHRFSGTVEIYVTDWCGYCRQAQKYMSSKGIPFVAYNIEKDSAAKKRHAELGGKGVPLIIIGSNKMSGFSPDGLEHYLNNSR